MHVSKQKVEQMRKRLEDAQVRRRDCKPMVPIYFKRNSIDGGELDWGRTVRSRKVFL